MIIELHILQNFAPANLNRDDTGSPKDCYFGGYRRARISSQCLKRAIRDEFTSAHLIDSQFLSERTKRIVDELTKRLAASGRPEAESRKVAIALLNETGLKVVKEDKTQYLLFLAVGEINAAVDIANQHWNALSTATQAREETEGVDAGSTKAKAELLPSQIKTEMLQRLDGGRAADLALFGRMIANLKERNVEAACQVAHAISTNKIEVEFDFFTAVDDHRPQETTNADMLGSVEFNSACFYRYANVDTGQLIENLRGDEALARSTLAAFLRASVSAVPSGKQNSMAAYNPPSLVFLVVRERGQWNLANAFLNPIRPNPPVDLVQTSIAALDAYWGKLADMYGDAPSRAWLATTEPGQLIHLKGYRDENKSSVEQVIASALVASTFGATQVVI